MKTLPMPCVQQSIEFFDDPEALGCLLHEVIYLTTKTRHGEVLIGEISESAKQLGYRGAVAPVRSLLLANGFVSEIERGSIFRIQEENREIIEHFFDTHQSLFERRGLTVLEEVSLFEHVGPGGSAVEVALTQVMRSISFMLDVLHTLPELHEDARKSLALSEIEHFIAFERVKWFDERTMAYSHVAEMTRIAHGSDSGIFRDALARYISMHIHLSDVVTYAEDQNDKFKSLIHDMETIKLLMLLHDFLKKFTQLFVQKEAEGE